MTCTDCPLCHPVPQAGTYTPWVPDAAHTGPVATQPGADRPTGYTTFQPAPGEPARPLKPPAGCGFGFPTDGGTTWQPHPTPESEERPWWSPEPLGLDLTASRKAEREARKADKEADREARKARKAARPRPAKTTRHTLRWALIGVGALTVIGATGFVAAGRLPSSSDAARITSGGSGTPTPTATHAPRPVSTTAMGDVTLAAGTNLTGPDTAGGYTSHFTIINSSPKRSDYRINLSLESKDRTTQFATAVVTDVNVEPGQTARVDAVFKTSGAVDGDAKTRVITVRRTTSTP